MIAGHNKFVRAQLRRRFRAKFKRANRARLFAALGSVCKICGATERLEFDLIIASLDDRHHRMNSFDRSRFYIEQHFCFRNVQVLCTHCNAVKSVGERAYGKRPGLVPF